MIGPDEILKFWLDELEPKAWYTADEELDAEMRSRFQEAWEGAMAGRFSLWLTYPTGTLAYILLTDQFSRNMFRDRALAFSSDRIALAAAKMAIDKGWDMKVDEPARIFFYMPLMHSESLDDQERCVRLICERMPQNGHMSLDHAKAHRKIIRDFGRFPYRNTALSRNSTGAEQAYLAGGGYGSTVRALEARKAG